MKFCQRFKKKFEENLPKFERNNMDEMLSKFTRNSGKSWKILIKFEKISENV